MSTQRTKMDGTSVRCREEEDAILVQTFRALKPHEWSPANSEGILDESHYGSDGRLMLLSVTPAMVEKLSKLNKH